MLQYLIRRLLLGLLTLLLTTFLIYGLIRNMPGSPLTVDQAQMDPSRGISAAEQERLKRIYGLDKPWYVAYWPWLANFVTLDLGTSFSFKHPVTKVIGDRLGPTLMLSGSALGLAYLLSIPLGLYFSARDGKLDERAGSTLLYMLYSLPSFVAALFLQMTFYVRLEWLPLYGMHSENYDQLSAWGQTWDLFLHALLPTVCLTYGSLAYYSRFIHSNMQEVVRQDYIRTARAKGVARWTILVHHAFRNTLIPLVTLLGLTLPSIFSGAVIIEQIFNWPGIGSLFFDSIRTRDYPVLMGLTVLFTMMTLAGQLLADLLYAVVDPRITYS